MMNMKVSPSLATSVGRDTSSTHRFSMIRCILSLVVFFTLFSKTTGMIVENEKFSITSDYRFTTLFSFYFDKEGTIDFSLKMTSGLAKPVYGFFCSENELAVLRNTEVTFEQLCEPQMRDNLCNIHHTFPATESSGSSWVLPTTSIPERDRFRLLQLNCDKISYKASLSYVAKNPGGEYLSLVHIPYKTLFYFLAGAWIILVGLWCFNLFRYAQWNTRSQRLLVSVPFFKAVACILMIGYWRKSSETGHVPQGYYWTGFLAVLATRGFLFFSILMMAMGLGMTCTTVPYEYSKRMGLMVAFYVVALALYQMKFEMAFLLLVINYAFIWQLLGMFIGFTQRELDSQVEFLRQMEIRVSSLPLYHKIQTFRELNSAVIWFVICDVFLLLWSSVFTLNMPWMEDILDNAVMFVLAARIYYRYALRPFNPHFNALAKTFSQTQTLTNQESTTVLNELRSRIVGLDSDWPENEPYVQPNMAVQLPSTLWRPGKPYPRPLPLDSEILIRPSAPRENCVIVLHNPCNCASNDGSGSIDNRLRSPNGVYNRSPCQHCELGVMFSKIERARAVPSSTGAGYTGIATRISPPSSGSSDYQAVGGHGSLNSDDFVTVPSPNAPSFQSINHGYIDDEDDDDDDNGGHNEPVGSFQLQTKGASAMNSPVTSPIPGSETSTPQSQSSQSTQSRVRMERERAKGALGNLLAKATSKKSQKYERLGSEEQD